MRSVVLFHHATSKYGVLGQMIKDLRSAFERAGIRAVIQEFQGKDASVLVDAVRQMHPDCTWSINTYVDERWFYFPSGIPHVDLSVDSVTYSHPAVFSQPHLVSLFVDKASCDLFSTYSDRPVGWFPHAISKEVIDHARASAIIPLNRRPYDVTLIGSFLDHMAEMQAWQALFSPSDVAAFVSYAERALADPSFPFFAAVLAFIEQTTSVKEVLERINLSPFSLTNSIERYVRGLDRERLLYALKGQAVHIFTDKEDAIRWSKVDAAKECLFNPPVPFMDVIDICRMSNVVINSAPHIRHGYHERLFLSLASGAVTLVRKGVELPSWLVDTGRVVEYESHLLEGLVPRLQEAAQRPFDAEKILSWLTTEHTWDARLAQHLPTIEKSVAELHAIWEENPFWRASGE